MISSDLIFAVRNGNLSEAKKLIERYGLSYAQQWSNGYNLLLDALKNEHVEIAKLLLKYGSKVNTKVKKPSDTPLHIAARNGIPEVVRMIIHRGANVNAQDKSGQSPLHCAIDKQRIEVTLILLQYGAHVNVKDFLGKTPLHIAVDRENFVIVETLLMKYGIDVNARDEHDEIPIHIAVRKACSQTRKQETTICKGQEKHCAAFDSVEQKGSKEIVSLLLAKGAHVNYRLYGHTPLHVAVEKGFKSIVENLLSHGASVDSTFSSLEMVDYTSLHLACKRGFENIVVLLLEKGSDINAATRDNFTPLDFAVSGGYNNIVELLLARGASFTVQNHDLLFKSVEKGYLEIVKLFLLGSCHIDMIYKDVSLIHCAAKYSQEEVVELLLHYKAKVNGQDGSGKTPLVYAVENGNYRIIKSLLFKGAKMEKNSGMLNSAVKRGLITVVEELLLHGADVNVCDCDGKTPLQLAIENPEEKYVDSGGRAKMVKLLLKKGAQAGIKNTQSGLTVLHTASQKGYTKVVRILLKYSADVNAWTKTGMTALHYAALECHREVVRSLLKFGAKVECRTFKYDLLPLHLAAMNGDEKIVETLFEYDADINSTAHSGKTALHFASGKGHLDVVRTLLRNGCDVNILDCHQRTPLDYVLRGVKLRFREQDHDENFITKQSLDSNSNHDPPDYRKTIDNSIVNTLQEVAKVIQSHVLQRQIAGLFVSKEYQQRNFNSSLDSFFKLQGASVEKDLRRNCENEITLMRKEMINNSILSVYDILTISTDSLSLYMRNDDILEIFKSKSYKSKFPLYADMIDDKFKQGLKRLELVEEGAELFCLLNNDFALLPSELRQRICGYLSNNNLRALADACKLIINGQCDPKVSDELIISKISQISLKSS